MILPIKIHWCLLDSLGYIPCSTESNIQHQSGFWHKQHLPKPFTAWPKKPEVVVSPPELKNLRYLAGKSHPICHMWYICIGSTFHPVTVTTKIIPSLVGHPYQTSFVALTGWGCYTELLHMLHGRLLLLMVQRSGGHQFRLVVYPIIYKI